VTCPIGLVIYDDGTIAAPHEVLRDTLEHELRSIGHKGPFRRIWLMRQDKVSEIGASDVPDKSTENQFNADLVFCILAIQTAAQSSQAVQKRSRWLGAATGAGIGLVASHIASLSTYLEIHWLRGAVVASVFSLFACAAQELWSLTIPAQPANDPDLGALIRKVGFEAVFERLGDTVPFYMHRGWQNANEGGHFHFERLGALLLSKHHRLREIFFAQVVALVVAAALLATAIVFN
jgi:hypothetical protein